MHILYDVVLTSVTETGYGLRFSEAEYNIAEMQYDHISNGVATVIEDVSAVIYCTGYQIDMSMLDKPLTDTTFTIFNEIWFEFPTSWMMSKHSLTEPIDVVNSDNDIDSDFIGIIPCIYHGLLISNPNMMFMRELESNSPLFKIGAQACLLLAYVMGDLDTPSKEKINL